MLFILETMWRGINKQIDIEGMAIEAADKLAEEAGRRKSSLMDDIKRRGSVMIDGIKAKTGWGIKDADI